MITPRYYQREAVDSIYRYFQFNTGNPLISAATGSGKSVMIALFASEVIQQWPDQRFMVLAHVKELLQQNAEKLIHLCDDDISIGIYSAGLKKRDTEHQIICGGIQSVYRRPFEFGKIDLLIIDEAHLVSLENDTMYQTFIAKMKIANPYLKVIGFTATPYRMKTGVLTEGENAIFTDIIYETDIKKLIEEGYLSNLITKGGVQEISREGLHKRGGELIESEVSERMKSVTEAAVEEICHYMLDRKKGLVFCATVEDSYIVREMLKEEQGFSAEVIESNTSDDDRDLYLQQFKRGELDFLVNKGVLTTGIDVPDIDLIAMLMATESPGLYSQILGRGLRIAPGKDNCLVLDYGGNVDRHGPVDEIRISGKKLVSAEPGEAPVKKCPQCNTHNHAAVRMCIECGYVFPIDDGPKHSDKASSAEIISGQLEPAPHDVSSWEWYLHEKPGKPPSVRVEYFCGLKKHKQWLCFEHGGIARAKAVDMWRLFSEDPTPNTTDEALDYFTDHLKHTPPKRIIVKPGKYPEVLYAEV